MDIVGSIWTRGERGGDRANVGIREISVSSVAVCGEVMVQIGRKGGCGQLLDRLCGKQRKIGPAVMSARCMCFVCNCGKRLRL